MNVSELKKNQQHSPYRKIQNTTKNSVISSCYQIEFATVFLPGGEDLMLFFGPFGKITDWNPLKVVVPYILDLLLKDEISCEV